MIFSRAKRFPPIDPTYAWPIEGDESERIPASKPVKGIICAVIISLPIWIIIFVLILFGFGVI